MSVHPVSLASEFRTGDPFASGPLPIVLQDASFNHRWAVACIATDDTNDDGKIEIYFDQHGGVYGDEVDPFLFYDEGIVVSIDQYVGASADSRFIAYIYDGRFEVLDAETNERWDLTVLGASDSDDENPTLSHPGVDFSARGEVLFIRRDSVNSEVVLLNLLEGHAEPVFRAHSTIWRAYFVDADRKIEILVLPPEAEEFPTVKTTLSPRACRGTVGSYSSFGLDGEYEVVRQSLTRQPAPAVRPERIQGGPACFEGNVPVLAENDEGDQLIASGCDEFLITLGPLKWVVGD